MRAALGSGEPGQGGVLQQRVLVQQVLPSKHQQLSRKLSHKLQPPFCCRGFSRISGRTCQHDEHKLAGHLVF